MAMDNAGTVMPSDGTPGQESSIAQDGPEPPHRNGPFRDAVELPNVSPKIYVYPHSGSEIPDAFQGRFREVVNLFRLNTEQHPPLKPHLEHIDYELRMCGTSVDNAHPSILVFCRPSEFSCLRSLLNSKHLKIQYCLRKSYPKYSWKAWGKSPPESSDTFKPLFNLYFWRAQRPRILYSHEGLMDIINVPDVPGGRRFTSTIGCILDIDSTFYGLTAAHSLHQGIQTKHLLEIQSPALDHSQCGNLYGLDGNSTNTQSRATLSDNGSSISPRDDMDEPALTAQASLLDLDLDHHSNDDDDSDDDFVDDVEYHDLAEDDQEAPMVGERLELRSIPLGLDQMPNTAILAPTSCSALCDRCNVPDNDWALVALTGPQLLNAFFDANHTSQPTFFWKTQGRLPKEEVSVLIVASNHRVVRGLLQPTPSFLGGISRKMQAEYWTVVLSDGETLHSGDSGSVVIAADSPTVVFGHVVASNPLREVYVSPLEATMNQIMGFLETTHVSLPEPLPLLSGLAAHHLRKGDDYAFELLNYLDDLLQTTARTPDMSLIDSWSLSNRRAVLSRAVDDSLWATKDPEKIRILHKFSPVLPGMGPFFGLAGFPGNQFAIHQPSGSSHSFERSDEFDLETTSSTSIRDYGSEFGGSVDQADDQRRIRSADKSQSPKASHQTEPLDENASNDQGPSGSS
ncbi:hypothetical protein CEP54_007564 [Fusarium duplospermum]|uniref:Uncharacterized protein n=1 Tax=Fusarium duplospermum TaxID=1325734 RepID=A0A428Q0J3_9HYPO|nr:hypothetical protein CEP54_007564 [Fusarium duplospermum]